MLMLFKKFIHDAMFTQNISLDFPSTICESRQATGMYMYHTSTWWHIRKSYRNHYREAF